MTRIPEAPTASSLLEWYDRHHRDLPWRISPAMAARGIKPDPYHIWLSEVMLQQTTVAAVKAYFAKFIARWPTVEDLAAAPNEDVMAAWAGLGYYARARNLKACAQVVAEKHGGDFPQTEVGLRALPGIGDYTAAAVAAIAFDQPAVVMDGNIERISTRIACIETPLPAARKPIRALVETLTPRKRPGDFAQAMMDLGAMICTPKRPACSLCPFRDSCQALHLHDPEHFPVKAQKKEKPVRYGAAFVAVTKDDRLLLRRRANSGLLGGMSEVPTTNWTARQDGESDIGAAPFSASWEPCGTIVHVFTHFELRLLVFRTRLDAPKEDSGWWTPLADLEDQGLPTVMKKAISQALPQAFRSHP